MRAAVNKETCIGCGLCATVAPEDFEMDSNGKAKSKSDIVKDEATVRQAVADCPVQAISLTE